MSKLQRLKDGEFRYGTAPSYIKEQIRRKFKLPYEGYVYKCRWSKRGINKWIVVSRRKAS